MGRGFVIGATAGRTTLTGEGLQHADGHSHLIASTNPGVVAYDPAFAYEISHIVKSGLERMYGSTESHPHGEDVWFYLTVYNEPIDQPADPTTSMWTACSEGIYRYVDAPEMSATTPHGDADRVRRRRAVGPEGARPPGREWGVGASVYSVTSWNELRRDAVETEKYNLLHPEDTARAVRHHGVARRCRPVPRVVATGCARCPTRSRASYPATTPRSAATGSGSPTPGPPPAGTSRSTRSRSWWRPWPRSPVATSTKIDQVRRRARRYRIDDPRAVAHVQQEGAGA